MKRYVITSRMLSDVEFEFAGNDNEAFIVLSDTQVIDKWSDILRDKGLVRLSGKRPFRITKARLSLQGSEGLGAGGGLAAELLCSLNAVGTDHNAIAEFSFNMARFGEWEDKDILIEPTGVDADWEGFSGDEFVKNRYCLFTIKENSTIYVNDFNIQEDFVGQTRKFILELEIEADMMLDGTSGVAV